MAVLRAGVQVSAAGLCEERPRPVPEGSGGPLTGRNLAPQHREQSGAWQHHFECQHTADHQRLGSAS